MLFVIDGDVDSQSGGPRGGGGNHEMEGLKDSIKATETSRPRGPSYSLF